MSAWTLIATSPAGDRQWKIRGLLEETKRLVAMAEGLLPRPATDDLTIQSCPPFKHEAERWTPT